MCDESGGAAAKGWVVSWGLALFILLMSSGKLIKKSVWDEINFMIRSPVYFG